MKTGYLTRGGKKIDGSDFELDPSGLGPVLACVITDMTELPEVPDGIVLDGQPLRLVVSLDDDPYLDKNNMSDALARQGCEPDDDDLWLSLWAHEPDGAVHWLEGCEGDWVYYRGDGRDGALFEWPDWRAGEAEDVAEIYAALAEARAAWRDAHAEAAEGSDDHANT